MAVYTYEDVIPTLIPNTGMQKGYIDGVHRDYIITPAEGYVLRDNANDVEEVDVNELKPTGRILFSYVYGSCTCGADYAFSPVQVTDENGVEYTAYGDRRFFATRIDQVDPERIFGLLRAEDAVKREARDGI
ncbi:MAG: hypothetical protein E7619_01705 [Ruminococcaceae bacterium]|nr:hypothetical protein [Oscillospiraceae bacterium]